MDKLNIAVIFGGVSNEYEVSLMSASSVIENIDNEKHNILMVGITRDGRWYRYTGGVENIACDKWHTLDEFCTPAVLSPDRTLGGLIEIDGGLVTVTRLDAAFPVMHGKNGEDGTIQGLIELAGIPLIGCGVLPSSICMDKDRAHKLVALAGIKCPDAAVFNRHSDINHIVLKTRLMRYPLFVKPVNGGSSIGISKIHEESQLKEAVLAALAHDDSVIIEEGIEGFEVGCAVMGIDELTVGEVDEIEIQGDLFDYTEKYTLATSKIHMPARIDGTLKTRIKETACVIYKTLGCRGFARVDMFLTPEGEIYFNEVNTIPGFTSHSRFPNMMKGAGLSYADVLDSLIGMSVGGEASAKRSYKGRGAKTAPAPIA